MDDSPQENKLPGDNSQQFDDEIEPTYSVEEVPPLAEPDQQPDGEVDPFQLTLNEESSEFDIQSDVEGIDPVDTIQEEQPSEEDPQQIADPVDPIFTFEKVQPLDEIDVQVNDENDPPITTQLEQEFETDIQPLIEETDPVYTYRENEQIEDGYPERVQEASPLYSSVEVVPEVNPKKIALILSGGGARGAFQVGAEMYARQVKGYHWDIIAGVSVGAMNGGMLSMHRYSRLLEIWDHISDEQIFTGGFNMPSVIKLLLGAKSFYGNEPLQRMMKQEFEAGQIIDDLHIGAVSLITGDYVTFTKGFLELPAAILASSSIPVIWPPVDVSPEHLAMVDGGVRNISPVSDVLELEPDEIVIINCSPESPPAAPNSPANVLTIGMRTLDIMQNEIFINDVKEFLNINSLVKEAEASGVVLHHPRTGRPYKYYPYVLIEPDIELGETLDFSQQAVQAALKAGVRRARQVLGRP